MVKEEYKLEEYFNRIKEVKKLKLKYLNGTDKEKKDAELIEEALNGIWSSISEVSMRITNNEKRELQLPVLRALILYTLITPPEEYKDSDTIKKIIDYACEGNKMATAIIKHNLIRTDNVRVGLKYDEAMIDYKKLIGLKQFLPSVQDESLKEVLQKALDGDEAAFEIVLENMEVNYDAEQQMTINVNENVIKSLFSGIDYDSNGVR